MSARIWQQRRANKLRQRFLKWWIEQRLERAAFQRRVEVAMCAVVDHLREQPGGKL